ncbi:MAG: hypothetical protein EB110_05055 [Betaproteobacteria bacterium]|nr:hypothetical protein [Betaproteobacteria bacterium]
MNSNGNGDLTVDAYDSNGNKLGTAEVKPDGSFEITLSRAYSGIVVLKSYDKNPKRENHAIDTRRQFESRRYAQGRRHTQYRRHQQQQN